jgi:L-galactono-1,4-lactone dehydrogenase
VKKLLKLLEDSKIPAPAPIEQRWTARSTAPMSPAYSSSPDDVFSWVGIIMYLPPLGDDASSSSSSSTQAKNKSKRELITQHFDSYKSILQPLMDEYGASIHWAKIELPAKGSDDYDKKIIQLREIVAKRYPISQFNQFRQALDPNNILSNNVVDALISDFKSI